MTPVNRIWLNLHSNVDWISKSLINGAAICKMFWNLNLKIALTLCMILKEKYRMMFIFSVNVGIKLAGDFVGQNHCCFLKHFLNFFQTSYLMIGKIKIIIFWFSIILQCPPNIHDWLFRSLVMIFICSINIILFFRNKNEDCRYFVLIF